jgi:hypothetical protein
MGFSPAILSGFPASSQPSEAGRIADRGNYQARATVLIQPAFSPKELIFVIERPCAARIF